MLTGLFFSRFLISTATIGLSALWLLLPGKKNLLVRWREQPLAVAAALIPLVYLLSGLNSQDTRAYLDVLKNSLPYLFIPLGLLGLPAFTPAVKRGLLGFFILLLLISGTGTFYYYIEHRDVVAESYARGQILPTVMHHVSYSVLLVFGILAGMAGLLNAVFEKRYRAACLFGLPVLFLVGLIHILATRTGLVLFYLVVPVYLLVRGLKAKAYPGITLSALVLLLVAVIAFRYSDTLKAKLDYMRYDLHHIRENKNTDNQLSDSRRLLSDQMGWELFLGHPLTGVGIGDVRGAIEKMYEARYPAFSADTRGHIHNQYLYILAGGGILAGLLFILAVTYPVYHHFRRGDALMGAVSLALMLVLLWEPFLAYQYGNTISLLVWIVGLQNRQAS